MLIFIDGRERSLIDACKSYIEKYDNLSLHIRIINESLPLGDIIIKDDDEKEVIIIERKTINDLSSSIRDSRYYEQSFRLSECNIPNHYIYYLIEGNFSSLQNHTRINKQSILSAMTSLTYFKGFSVHRTLNVNETAEWLIRTADKIRRETKQPYYNSNNANNVNSASTDTLNTYSSVSKRVKKNNITKTNIGEIMLMQIPGVSVAAAQCIMITHKTIKNLINNLEENENILDHLTLETKTGKERKLNKTTKLNIKEFLSHNI